MMPTLTDLRAVLSELADSVDEAPDPGFADRARSHSHAGRTVVAVAVVAVLAVVVVTIGALGLPRRTGTSTAIPPAQAPARVVPTPSPTSGPTADGAATRVGPMSAAQIRARTASCLASGDLRTHRQGKLVVRYAMIQTAVGDPGAPQQVLLLQDDGGYYDCATGAGTWVTLSGDHVTRDPSAQGLALPTISGGSTARCDPAHRSGSTVTSAVVIMTSSVARTARVTLTTHAGRRTADVPVVDGYVYVTARIAGVVAWHAATLGVQLLDADGRPLIVQDYGQSAGERLSYPVDGCHG